MFDKGKYNKFVFFSAGPIGDHVLLIDVANYFFESTGIPSVLLMKHPNAFLHELSAPYVNHITHLDFVGIKGVLKMVELSILSLFQKNCYVLVFPVPLPLYLRVFVTYIRFFTRSRIVGFSIDGTKSFPKGKGYEYYLGKNNTIPLLAEMYYKSANRMLSFLGYKEVIRLPKLEYLYSENIFARFDIEKNNYIVMHVKASHALRSLPVDRWNNIIANVVKVFPDVKIIFTGSKQDIPFIMDCIKGESEKCSIIAAGKTNTQELLTLYANARLNVTVQTGNGLIINLLHVPTVVVNIKGTAMFYYDFNEQATILYSKENCRCNPFETECNMVKYKGEEYMSCLFNISDKEVVDAIVNKYKKN